MNSGENNISAPAAGDRISYLDNLRVSLTVLVICHHVHAAYGSPGGWSYIVHARGGVIGEIFGTMFAGITQAFFMSSFFLISAYLTAPAFDHKGPVKFMRRRLVRLGIPLVFYFYVLSVVMHYIVRSFEGRMDVGFFEFFSSNFLDYGEPGPLWFAMTLLIFESVYLVFRLVMKHLKRPVRSYPLPTDRQIFAFIIGIGFFTFLVRQYFPLTIGVYHLRIAFFPLYVCMFTFGIMAYRSDWFTQLSTKQANRWFNAALAAIALMPIILLISEKLGYDAYDFWGGLNWRCYAYAAWEPFLCVGINMKLIVLYRDRFNWSTPLTKSMARSSFTAYIFHAFFVVFSTYAFTFFSLGRIPEILLMWPVAVIPCFVFADGVRRLPVLSRVLG